MDTESSFVDYQKKFASFREISDGLENVIKWLRSNKLQLNFDSTYRILSVGSGTGSFDLQFVTLFKNLTEYTVVEPNRLHIQEFMRLAGNVFPFVFHQQTLEEYEPKAKQDLVVVSHALYYMKDKKESLRKLTQLAKQTLIFHQSTFGIHHLQRLFGTAPTQNYILSSDQILRYLSELGLHHSRQRIEGHIRVENIQDIHLDFFMERQNTDQEKQELRAYLGSNFPDGKMYHPVDVILVEGSSSANHD